MPTCLCTATSNTLAPFWGAVNWNERFVSAANPNMLYFNEDASANVNNEAGVRAFTELLKSLEYHEPGALEKDWFAQYQLMGAGNGFMGGSFPNETKLVPGNPDLDTAGVGEYIKSDVTPGREVDGVLVRRPVIFYNISYGVNAFADPSHHEAAYLFLQWAGGARVYTWLTFNPGGYQDPHHTYTLSDPYTSQSYKPQPLGQFANIIPRTAPPITLKGGGAYRDSLSEELQKVLTEAAVSGAGCGGAREALEHRSPTSRAPTFRSRRCRRSTPRSRPTVDPPGEQLAVTDVTDGCDSSVVISRRS